MSRFSLAFAVLLSGALPAFAGPACQAEIAKFQKLIDGDLKTGFIAKPVYEKANVEVAKAGSLCAAGQDAAALAALRATKTRHGYP